MRPEETIKLVTQYIKNLEKAKKSAIYVGLPKEKVGGKVYGTGINVIEVGAIHEFGSGPIPQRSFLRVPFSVKQKELEKALTNQFRLVATQGKDATKALSVVAVLAQSIAQEAFTTRGFGKWPDISEETKRRKGSTQPLIDTGTLRGSITWVVR